MIVRWLFRVLGIKIAQKAFTVGRGGRAPLIDIGFGFALLKDRRVPLASKLAALGLGGLIVAALLAMEAPVEALIALLLNIPGLGFDVMVDGLEMLAGPVLIGCALLPRLLPAALVTELRTERYGVSPGPTPQLGIRTGAS